MQFNSTPHLHIQLKLGTTSISVLAAWFRMKYPHVAIGVLASSAPILQFLDLISPYTFANIVTQDYKVKNCQTRIQIANYIQRIQYTHIKARELRDCGMEFMTQHIKYFYNYHFLFIKLKNCQLRYIKQILILDKKIKQILII